LLPSNKTMAGVDDCLKAALNTANPSDLKNAAAFATSHPSCLANLAPPTLVPYIALSGSLDLANQSGALNQVGLGFSDYPQCADKVNPGNAAIKQLAPVLQPVCGTLNMDCSVFEGPAVNEVNAQLASEVPLLSLLPCSCAAANSKLGVEKIAELVKQTQKCGATIAQVGEALGDAAKGVYDVAGDAVGYGSDAAAYAMKLGEDIAKSVGDVTCAISTLWGGCKSTPPSYKTTATAICKAHGATWWAASKTQAPNDLWAQCNDGLYCWAQPGENLRCQQRRTPAQRNNDIAAMKQWCPQREQELEAGYQQQCHDGACKIAVTNVASIYGVECMKWVNGSENQKLPSDLVGAEMKEWLSYRQDQYGTLSRFNTLITESIQRDPKTPPLELLRTYDCRSFLGRANQALCKWPTGYAVCKKLADAGKMEKCYLKGGGEYPLLTISPAVLGALGKANVTKIPTTTASQSEPAILTEVSPTVIANGSLLRATQATSATATPSIVVSDTFLANAALKGCRPFLGRRDELKCDNQAGFDECMQAVNRNMLKQCHNAVNDKP
ncbi:MAG: hypothetical protein KA365_06130, partial [Arenimonas sp.]|nr:hypothetical protein [Arenimonas sp.]MBP6310111.1 hypothetical protein [Arenimonas sp.]